ncbi:MAG: HlyD family efflux transporter periplasmic adaptor subunit [Verrucomicrobia bacterium]|nr:HlyD family efflux transporter periplasmic adaptor subunit [Verrucomicrobiota bacterium]
MDPPSAQAMAAVPQVPMAHAAPASRPKSRNEIPVYSPFDGKVEVVSVLVRTGDNVSVGQVVAAVEALKANHDVKAPVTGVVLRIDASPGAIVSSGQPILTLVN